MMNNDGNNNILDEFNSSPGVMSPKYGDRLDGVEIGVIRELSPKKVKERIMVELKGYDYDFEEQKYVKQDGFIPLMNNLGIQKFLNALPALSDTVTFSNYTQEQIKSIVKYSMRSVIPTIYVHYKEYGILNKSDLPVLINLLFTLTYAAYMKASGAGDRGIIGKTTTEAIVNRAGQIDNKIQQEKRGLFNNINPFRR